VKFSWEYSNGSTMRGEGHTRDISATGVFVLTAHPLPSGAVVKLEVSLPSLRAPQQPGVRLQTLGHVVRSEPLGFAAAADTGFRMNSPDAEPSQWLTTNFRKQDASAVESSRGLTLRFLA